MKRFTHSRPNSIKRMLALLCAAFMTLSLAACQRTETIAYAGQTVVGQVTAISGTTVTLQKGTWAQGPGAADGQNDNGQPPAPPQSDSNNDSNSGTTNSGNSQNSGNNAAAQNGTGNTPPQGGAMSGQTPPAAPGQNNSGQIPPAKPSDAPGQNGQENQTENGTSPSGNGNNAADSTANGGTPSADSANRSLVSLSAASDADTSSDTDTNTGVSAGNPPGDPPSGGAPSHAFTAGNETFTTDLGDTAITQNGTAVSLSAVSVGTILRITFDDSGNATAAEIVSAAAGGSGGGQNSGTVTQGSSANTLTEDQTVSNTVYTSKGDNENALRVDGAAVTLSGITVEKSAGASSSTENGDFYGVNAALLATNGATVTLKNATVTSSAQNGNGVFSYGSGTVVNLSDCRITTTADNSGGIQTTGGGTTNAENLTVGTAGNSSAAIRSDRGGGTVNVTGGNYQSNGYNSPAVYSTAAITVKNATLTAKNSEALVIEGQNSITLQNCTVTGNMSDTKGASSSENVHNVMIYQSMSGDAAVGTSAFAMTGGTLTGRNGDLFYVTNTACTLSLSGVTLENKDSDGNLLTVTGNSGKNGWGTAGQNGATVTMTATNQAMNGRIVVDSISTLSLTLSGNSTFTGTVNVVDNAAGGTAVSQNAIITVEKGSTWNLTGDCVISSLENHGTIQYNGHTITLADGTVLHG